MNVIGYTRSSTKEQGQRVSPALQRRAIEKWAADNDLTVGQWFSDSKPGSTPISKRPGLRAALEQLGPESVLIVFRLDRLVRGAELQFQLFRIVTAAGGRIVSTMNEGTNGLEEDSPDAKFMRGLAGILSERETDVLADRTRRAVRTRKAEGRKWNCNAPYGHRWDAGGKVAEHKAEQRTVQLVVELRGQGTTYRGIVAELKRRRRVNRVGRPFALAAVQGILRRAG